MKRIALISSLPALLLATACGPAPLDFSGAFLFVAATEGSARVDATFFRESGCTGAANDLEATINGGTATVTLEDDYGGGGGLPPSLFSLGCSLLATRTIESVDGAAADLIAEVTAGDDTISASAPAGLRGFAVSPATITEGVRPGETLTFTIDPPPGQGFSAFVTLQQDAAAGLAPADAVLTGDTLSVVVPNTSSGPGAATLEIRLGFTDSCAFEAGGCQSEYEFSITRALTLVN